MFKLIKNVRVYNPYDAGIKDILICYNKIVKIDDLIEYDGADVIEATGMIAIPGIIDQHVHVTGGGGEGGFHTRAPEITLSSLIESGTTTVVGLLGTDSLTRSVENLVAKTKALNYEGLTAYCLTGAYNYPSPTLTGSVSKDIAYVAEMIGVKLAISDHRESHITESELKKLAGEVRVASMVSGKPGIITLHIGNDSARLDLIFKILNETSIPIHLFRPTHVNRNEALFESALEFLNKGGYIDLTVGSPNQQLTDYLQQIKSKQLDLTKVTFSTDSNGSWSKYDESGKLIKIGVQDAKGIISSMKYLIETGYPVTEAIRFGTTNVAHALNLEHKKGYLKVGFDADLVLLNQNFEIDTVMAGGKLMMYQKKIIVKGTFER